MSVCVNVAGDLMYVCCCCFFQRVTPGCVCRCPGNAWRTERPGLNTMSSQDKWVTLTPAEFALLQEYTQCE